MAIILIILLFITGAMCYSYAKGDGEEYKSWKGTFYRVTLEVVNFILRRTPSKIVMYAISSIVALIELSALSIPFRSAIISYNKGEGFWNVFLSFDFDDVGMPIIIVGIFAILIIVGLYIWKYNFVSDEDKQILAEASEIKGEVKKGNKVLEEIHENTKEMRGDLAHLLENSEIILANHARIPLPPKPDCRVYIMENEKLCGQATIRPRFWKYHYVPIKNSQPIPQNPKKPFFAMSGIELTMAIINEKIAKSNKGQSQSVIIKAYSQTIDYSLCPILFKVKNECNVGLDNVYAFIWADSNVNFFEKNKEDVGIRLNTMKLDYSIDKDKHGIHVHIGDLNASMVYPMDRVYVQAPSDVGSFTLFWEISEKSYSQKGKLTVIVDPIYELKDIEKDNMVGKDDTIEPYKEYK